MNRTSALVCAAVAIIVQAGPGPAAAVQYQHFLSLGRLNPSYGTGTAYGINGEGVVVGQIRVSSSDDHAFIWDRDNGMRDLTLGYNTSSRANDINDSGTVVGYVGGYCQERATRWDQSGHVDYLGAAGIRSYALATNVSSEVVGATTVTVPGVGEYLHACYWDTVGAAHDLGTLGGLRSEAYDINCQGVIVGTASAIVSNTEYTRGFVWTASQGMLALPTLGGLSSYAYGINDSGCIVGYATDALGRRRACTWQMVSAPIPILSVRQEGESRAINSAGQVTGSYNNDIAVAPYVWSSADGVVGLENMFGEGRAINDSGWVAGSYGEPALWIPVPEPSTILALLCGLGALAWRRRT